MWIQAEQSKRAVTQLEDITPDIIYEKLSEREKDERKRESFLIRK